MIPEIWVTHFSSGKTERYVPPPEIRALLHDNPYVQRIAELLGINPALQKWWGNLFGREAFSADVFRPHRSHAPDTPVLPSDGYLTRSPIAPNGTSHVLDKISIDLQKMLGLSAPSDEMREDECEFFDPIYALRVQTTMAKKFESFREGQHDLAILKPRHKHVCSVPFRSKLTLSYRVNNTGYIFPSDLPLHKFPNEKTFTTDPAFVLKNAKQTDIFDGNQRMVFVMRTTETESPLEYVIVAHAAAFVRGIESIAHPSDVVEPGEKLFKFHQGSSLSVLWPQEFCEQFEPLPDVVATTTTNHVLEVLEGEQIYEKSPSSDTGQ